MPICSKVLFRCRLPSPSFCFSFPSLPPPPPPPIPHRFLSRSLFTPPSSFPPLPSSTLLLLFRLSPPSPPSPLPPVRPLLSFSTPPTPLPTTTSLLLCYSPPSFLSSPLFFPSPVDLVKAGGGLNQSSVSSIICEGINFNLLD